MLIILVIVVIVGLLLIRNENNMSREYQQEVNFNQSRLNGAKLGTRVRILKGKNYGQAGIIADYDLLQTVDIKCDNGNYETLVFLKDLELISN